jgi:hypothetical protein
MLQFDPPMSEQTKELRWDERMKAVLDVDDEESLASVMQRAKREFDLKPRVLRSRGVFEEMAPEGVAGLPYFFRFYEADNDPPLAQRGSSLFAFNLETIDQQGRAHWNRKSDEIPFGDLVRAGDAGLLNGDPLRPYLVLSLPQGGGGVLTDAWNVLQTVWTIMGGLTGTIAFAKLTATQTSRLKEMLQRGSVVHKKAEDWTSRGGGPYEIRKTIERHPWAPDDMRALLDVDTDDEAVAVLELFGAARNDDGTYSLADTAEASLLRVVEDEALQLARFGYRELSEADKKMVQERLRIIFETGERVKELPPSPPR